MRVIPERRRTSVVADVRILYVLISGKPEIGCGEPGIHNHVPRVTDSGLPYLAASRNDWASICGCARKRLRFVETILVHSCKISAQKYDLNGTEFRFADFISGD
jgi:hypothetical protein